MIGQFILGVLTCGPLVIALAVWLYWTRRNHKHALALFALGLATANATFACLTFVYYGFKPPSSSLPPWQDPEILQLALLLLLAPIAMVLGVVAGVRRAPRWLVGIVLVVSLPLFLVGIMAGSAV